jgi:hypothetical protein
VLTVASLAALQRAIRRTLGGPTAAAFMLLTAAQFHLPFYLSRTLPNVLAMPLTNLGLAAWLQGGRPTAVVHLLTAAAVRAVPVDAPWPVVAANWTTHPAQLPPLPRPRSCSGAT